MSSYNNNTFKSNLLYLACLSITSTQSAYSWSQQSPENIEEVIISAQMRDENIQAVPIAIGVYDQKFIDRAGASSLTDMESSIPNINFGSGARSTRGEIAIRGISDYSRNIGTNARVAVYVDGVLTGRSSSFDQSLFDVDHIEVLRGPQGTLAGTNALAGSINIITQKPGDKFDAELLTDVGNYNLRTLSGKINAPLSSDLFASLSIGKTEQDGYIHNITLNSDLQNVDRDTAKLKLRYIGVENLTIDVGFDYLNDDNKSTNDEALANGKFNGFTLAPQPYVVAHNADEFSKRQLKGATITANYITPENYQWVSITGIRKSEFSERSEEDYSPLDVASSLFNEQDDQFSQELRLVSPKNNNFDYVLGAYFLDQDLATQRSANAGALFPVPFGVVKTPATSDEKSSSVYLHGNYYFAEKWEANGGLRYVHEAKSIDYSSIDSIGSFINVNHLRDQQTFNELLPKIGLDYHASSNVFIYSSISRGYKSGGWNADFLTTLENFQFNPEYAINYELGIKSTLFDNQLTLNASSFVTKIRDFQIFQFVPTQTKGTILSLTNAGKVTSQGIEIDINEKITPNLSTTFNAALTQAKFDEFKNGGGLGINYDNKFLPFAPEHSYYVALDYNKSLSTNIGFYSHIDCSYTGNYFSNADNAATNSIENHYTINTRAGITLDSHWDISLWAKNLTDQINLRQRSVSFLGVPRGYYDPPRFYGLNIKYTLN